jgi:hypothetical protein
MSLVSNTDLQNGLDKFCRWLSMSVGDANFQNDFNAGMDAADLACFSGVDSLYNLIIATANESWIGDLANAAKNVDENPPTPPSRFLFSVPGAAAIITAINNHIKTYGGGPTTLDAYLTSLNGPLSAQTPTLRVHQTYYDHFATLSRQNVFIGVDTLLAHVVATGPTAATFTADAALPTFVAGAKVVAKNNGALTSDTTVSITGKKIDGTTATLTATITTHTDGHETDLSSVLKLFVAVTALNSISGATSGNRIDFVAKTDRDITNA